MRSRVLLFMVTVLAAVEAGGAVGPGQYEVGVTSKTFTKTSVTSGEPRPLLTVIWYPAVPGTGAEEALGRRDADVVDKAFPWIVFSHGNCGLPTEASYLTMALASRGFVVAAPSHTGNTKTDPGCTAAFADSFANRVPDMMFVIDSMLDENADAVSRFADRLQAERVGIAGLSFGGFTTLLAAQRDARLRAALSMVPGGTGALDRNDIAIPTMVIGGEHDIVVGFAESQHAYDRLAGPRFLIELLAANHLAVTDDCFPLCGPNDIPQAVAHRLVQHYALAFFRRFLAQGLSAGAGPIRPLPHVRLTSDPLPASGS
jgi:predicted dienelactone hydrolase